MVLVVKQHRCTHSASCVCIKGHLSEDALFLVFRHMNWNPRLIAVLSCVCKWFDEVAKQVLWKEFCHARAPKMMLDLHSGGSHIVDGNWKALGKLLIYCNGCTKGGLFNNIHVPGHFVFRTRFSRTAGKSFLPQQCRNDVLYVSDPCEHLDQGEEGDLGFFRGIFKSFATSRVKKMLIEKRARFHPSESCPYCKAKLWSMLEANMLPRSSSARLGAYEDSVEYFVCLNGHVIGIDDCCNKPSRNLSTQEIGIAKLPGFSEWFLNHFIMKEPADNDSLDSQSNCQKTIIFAHHLKVLDGVQAFVIEQRIKFVRIDGSTFPRERKVAVNSFRLNPEVKVAIIGITAGGVGIDFSSAQNVVFVELPKSASELLQAEDRAHRRGQTNAVNIYIFCAKNTLDESHWIHLNQSLFRVSSLMNGKKDAIREIEVDQVYHLEERSKTEGKAQHGFLPLENHNADCGNGPEENVGSDNMSIENLPGLADMDFESDFFSIRTIPLHFEDGSLHTVMQNSPSPTAHEEIACNSSISQASVVCPSISSSKSVKVRRRLSEIFQTLGLPATTDCHIQVKFLRFEVSQHTGRIHLYICVPGHDPRPRPLFENFLPEEIEPPLCSDNATKSSNRLLKRDPAFCNTFKAFVKEWLALSPIEQKRLLGKPLQLPLTLELCYLKDSTNHSTKGLLKGGSKRRATPLCDISNPLPENAEWRKVVLHTGTTKERVYTQGWTVHDEPLCKLCQEPCKGKLAKSPEYFEDLFCDLTCFEVYRSRTSNNFLRQGLLQIEHGICSMCKLDCSKLVKHIKPLFKEKREEYIRNVAPNIATRSKLLDKLVNEPNEGNAWHADHIVPVYKGGGECTLENLRTLCVACHYEVTREQQKERKELTKKAKELLNNTINNQQKDEASEAAEEDDESLLVVVPGSAYS